MIYINNIKRKKTPYINDRLFNLWLIKSLVVDSVSLKKGSIYIECKIIILLNR